MLLKSKTGKLIRFLWGHLNIFLTAPPNLSQVRELWKHADQSNQGGDAQSQAAKASQAHFLPRTSNEELQLPRHFPSWLRYSAAGGGSLWLSPLQRPLWSAPRFSRCSGVESGSLKGRDSCCGGPTRRPGRSRPSPVHADKRWLTVGPTHL